MARTPLNFTFDPDDPDDPLHGKDSTYRNLGCRCERCSSAATVAQQRYRAAHPEHKIARRKRAETQREVKLERIVEFKADPSDHRHGKKQGWMVGCRCPSCGAWKTEREAEVREQSRVRKQRWLDARRNLSE